MTSPSRFMSTGIDHANDPVPCGSVTGNDVDSTVPFVYAKHPGMPMTARSTPGAGNVRSPHITTPIGATFGTFETSSFQFALPSDGRPLDVMAIGMLGS